MRDPSPITSAAEAWHVDSALSHEDARVAALLAYDILDTPPEESFDLIARLAQKIFRTSMVTISLLDHDQQCFKSRVGMEAKTTSQDGAFCRVTVDRAAPFVVDDAREDPVFSTSRLVTGEPFVRFYAGAPLLTAEGHALGTLCVMDEQPRRFEAGEISILADLARLVMDEMDLRRLANVDALTGALSRRAFREEAQRALSLAERERRPVSLLLFDLDRFKQVNDTHGHAAGDIVLKRSVDACLRRLRRSDALGRIGGEEFAVLLHHADSAGALAVAESLRREMASQSFEGEGGGFSVTASFGVVTSSGSADLDATLSAADKALYRAKAGGRDLCVAAEPL